MPLSIYIQIYIYIYFNLYIHTDCDLSNLGPVGPASFHSQLQPKWAIKSTQLYKYLHRVPICTLTGPSLYNRSCISSLLLRQSAIRTQRLLLPIIPVMILMTVKSLCINYTHCLVGTSALFSRVLHFSQNKMFLLTFQLQQAHAYLSQIQGYFVQISSYLD